MVCGRSQDDRSMTGVNLGLARQIKDGQAEEPSGLCVPPCQPLRRGPCPPARGQTMWRLQQKDAGGGHLSPGLESDGLALPFYTPQLCDLHAEGPGTLKKPLPLRSSLFPSLCLGFFISKVGRQDQTRSSLTALVAWGHSVSHRPRCALPGKHAGQAGRGAPHRPESCWALCPMCSPLPEKGPVLGGGGSPGPGPPWLSPALWS